MLTLPAKVFLPLVGLGTVAAIVYAVMVGDPTGATMFLALAVAAAAGTMAITTTRDEAVSPAAADGPPPTMKPMGPVRLVGGPGWPSIAGVGAGLMAGGLVLGPILTAPAIALFLVSVVGWLGSVSIDRTRRVPNLMPIGIPVVGLGAIGSLMFFMSRILLAVPEQASTFIALGVAVLPQLSSRTLFTGLLVGALLLVGGGTVAGLIGQREVEEHHAGAEPVEVEAHNVQFSVGELRLEPETEALVDFKNEDTVPHNIAIYASSDYAGLALFQGAVITGGSKIEYKFKAPGPGTYYFRCDIHPVMQGKVTVA
jgi:plastocyanin